MLLPRNNFYALICAFLNVLFSSLTLLFINDYSFVVNIALISSILFCLICWFKKSNVLFLSRTVILGVIGYFPMFVKVINGEDALFSVYEKTSQTFDIVILMFFATSLALLSNEVGLAFARVNNNKKRTTLKHGKEINSTNNLLWKVSAIFGVCLCLFSAFFFIRNGQSILIVGYGENHESAGLPFGSIGVMGAVGLFSVFVAGTKGYFSYWKPVFLSLCAIFLIYSQILMGLRQDAMSSLFGIVVLYGVLNRREIGLKPEYIPLALILYIFFEFWGLARSLIAQGYTLSFIMQATLSQFNSNSSGIISVGTISPIATTFANIILLIKSGLLDYSWGLSYWEWILRIPPEIIYPNRPVDYSWLFEKFGLSAGGGFFELAEVYMNFGLLGALFIPGLISYLIAKSYYSAFYTQSVLSYFLLFGFLTIYLRGTWYQTFAFFRAIQVCLACYIIFLFITLICKEYLRLRNIN